MEENSTNNIWKPKFVSEFSMGSLDFERYNEWLKNCEKWSAFINSTEIPTLDMIQNFFASMNVLWKSWRPIVASPKKQEQIDLLIKKTKGLKRYWESNKNLEISKIKILNIVDELDELYTQLMEIKQLIGLGIVVKKNMNTKEKIRAGMKKQNYGYLPEP